MSLFCTYVLYFLFYSFFGWVYETTLVSLREKHFVNRGFLNGPVCPIYGFGALALLLILGDERNPLVLFILGALITGVLEYSVSWGMEKLFHARWWDYSQRKFNLNGRVCLAGMIVFGLFSVVLIDVLQPFVARALSPLPVAAVVGLAGGLLAAMGIDAAYTIAQFYRFYTLLRKGAAFFETATERVEEASEAALERYRIATGKINQQARRMLAAFPNLHFLEYEEPLAKVRTLLDDYRTLLKDYRTLIKTRSHR